MIIRYKGLYKIEEGHCPHHWLRASALLTDGTLLAVETGSAW
jgi:hypothetical protein